MGWGRAAPDATRVRAAGAARTGPAGLASALVLVLAFAGCGGSGTAATRSAAQRQLTAQASSTTAGASTTTKAASTGASNAPSTSARGTTAAPSGHGASGHGASGAAAGGTAGAASAQAFRSRAELICGRASRAGGLGLKRSRTGGSARQALTRALALQRAVDALSGLQPPPSLRAQARELLMSFKRLQQLALLGSRRVGGGLGQVVAITEQQATRAATALGAPACAPASLLGPGSTGQSPPQAQQPQVQQPQAQQPQAQQPRQGQQLPQTQAQGQQQQRPSP